MTVTGGVPVAIETPYDVERALLTKVIETGDVLQLLKARDPLALFTAASTARDVADWLICHYRSFGKAPSLRYVRSHFPEFEAERVDDELNEIMELARLRRLYGDLQVSLRRVTIAARESPQEALTTMRGETAALSVRYATGNVVDATKRGAEIRARYEQLEKKQGMIGIPWPWERLNRSSRGMRPGFFHGIYAAEGTMKTWLLIHIAEHAHATTGVVPVIFVYEMPLEDIEFRWAAYRARVDYERLQDGSLRRDERDRFYASLEQMQSDPPFYVEELECQGVGALGEIQAKSEEKRAGLVLIDGLTFVSEDFEWGSYGKATMGLKTLARKSRVPIVVTHHSNERIAAESKSKGSTRDVAGTPTLQRDVDVLLRLTRTPQHVENDEILVSTRKVREGKQCAFVIHAKPATNFSQKYVVEDDEQGGGSATHETRKPYVQEAGGMTTVPTGAPKEASNGGGFSY